jgi:hypothetical protein
LLLFAALRSLVCLQGFLGTLLLIFIVIITVRHQVKQQPISLACCS